MKGSESESESVLEVELGGGDVSFNKFRAMTDLVSLEGKGWAAGAIPDCGAKPGGCGGGVAKASPTISLC